MPAFDVIFQIMKVGNFNDMNQRGKLSDKVYLDSGQHVKETEKKCKRNSCLLNSVLGKPNRPGTASWRLSSDFIGQGFVGRKDRNLPH